MSDGPPDDRPSQRRRTGAGGAGGENPEENDPVTIQNVPDAVLREAIEYLNFEQQQTGAPAERWTSNRATELRSDDPARRLHFGPLPQMVYRTFNDAMDAFAEFRREWPNRLFTIRLRNQIVVRLNESDNEDYASIYDSSDDEWEDDEQRIKIRSFGVAMRILTEEHPNVSFLRVLTPEIEAIFENGSFSVTFNPSVQRIRPHEFEDCTNLTSVTFPEGLQIIGKRAFDSCIDLTSVVFPDSLQTIEKSAFSGCTNLISADLSQTSLTSIGEWSFHACRRLRSVTFPDALQTIGGFAFSLCKSLISVDLSRTNVKKIMYKTFPWCISLTSVAFPDTLKMILAEAFYHCNSLVSVAFPEGLQYIAERAFEECDSLTSVSISKDTFVNDNRIKNANISFYEEDDEPPEDDEPDEPEPKSGRGDWSGPTGGAASQFCALRF